MDKIPAETWNNLPPNFFTRNQGVIGDQANDRCYRQSQIQASSRSPHKRPYPTERVDPMGKKKVP